MAATTRLGQSSFHDGRRHSNTPSMTSASSVYDDDSVGSPGDPWQESEIVEPQVGLGAKKQEGHYSLDPRPNKSVLTTGKDVEIQLRDPSSRSNPNTAHGLSFFNPETRLPHDRSLSSSTVTQLAASSARAPAVPEKDVRRSRLLKSASDLKTAAISSPRNKSSKKDLGAGNSLASPTNKDCRVISNFSTSGTALRVPFSEPPPDDHVEDSETRDTCTSDSRRLTFNNPQSPLGLSSLDSDASPSDKMLSRIGRKIAHRSLQVKNELVDPEAATTDNTRESSSSSKPTLTLDITAAAPKLEPGPIWQLESNGPESNIAAPAPKWQTHERNTSSIYSTGSQKLVPNQNLSAHSTTFGPPSSQDLITIPPVVIIPAPRKVPYDAFEIPPPPLTDVHFMCYQNHVSMRPSSNRNAPVPCMACWTVDSEERWRCTFCAMRVCRVCAGRLQEDPVRSLGRLVELVEREG